jgi:translation initiation factor eIF-2B subunit alpha
VAATFEQLLKCEPELATAVAAIRTLILVLEKCAATTLQELVKLLKDATKQMKGQVDCSACSVTSGCELFLRFITLTSRLEEEVRKVAVTK